jgi:hypothetical protein
MDTTPPQGAATQLLSTEEQQWRAERELAEALSTFQSQVQPAAALTLEAVVAAARPAFQLGFCFSVRSSEQGTVVLLMHRCGGQQSAESDADDEDFTLSARLLAGLLGIPVASLPQPSKAEGNEELADGGQVDPAVASPAPAAPAALNAPVTAAVTAPDGEPVAPDHEPLSAEEIGSLTGMLKAMARSDKEAWQRFSAAFREHFAVPRTARTITDRINQRRHAVFIDRFDRELNAAAGTGSGGVSGEPEAI